MKALLFIGLAASALASNAAMANADLAKAKNCMACHAVANKVVGPSYKEIAAKYKGQDVVPTLMQKVRAGGKGNFGPIPMAPNPPEKIDETLQSFNGFHPLGRVGTAQDIASAITYTAS